VVADGMCAGGRTHGTRPLTRPLRLPLRRRPLKLVAAAMTHSPTPSPSLPLLGRSCATPTSLRVCAAGLVHRCYAVRSSGSVSGWAWAWAARKAGSSASAASMRTIVGNCAMSTLYLSAHAHTHTHTHICKGISIHTHAKAYAFTHTYTDAKA
jgi:hypothetical protein